jgi:hypothetical protein
MQLFKKFNSREHQNFAVLKSIFATIDSNCSRDFFCVQKRLKTRPVLWSPSIRRFDLDPKNSFAGAYDEINLVLARCSPIPKLGSELLISNIGSNFSAFAALPAQNDPFDLNLT